MRIALFHNVPSGGAKRAVREWVRRLALDHTIDVFSLSTADHEFCDIRPFVSRHHVYEFAPRRRFRPPLGRLDQYQRWRDLADLDRLHRRIATDINAGSYDVLFANSCAFTFVPLLLSYVAVPSAYYLHEPFGPGFTRRFQRPYIRKKNWHRFLDRCDPLIPLYQRRLAESQVNSLRRATTLLANSRFTSDCVEAAFGLTSQLSPCGVDVGQFFPSGEPRKQFVVSVGEMSPRKGFDFVVESLATIPAQSRPALRLACNMVKQKELRYVSALAQQRGVALEVLINQGIAELRRLYGSARLCVYTPVMEPFGLVPLEAMACGTPVVAVREGGVPESVVHESTGVLVERDAQKCGAAIHRLLANPRLADSYGRRGLEHVRERWSWERSAATLAAQLGDCAAATPASRV